jgi:hypothetical protein
MITRRNVGEEPEARIAGWSPARATVTSASSVAGPSPCVKRNAGTLTFSQSMMQFFA